MAQNRLASATVAIAALLLGQAARAASTSTVLAPFVCTADDGLLTVKIPTYGFTVDVPAPVTSNSANTVFTTNGTVVIETDTSAYGTLLALESAAQNLASCGFNDGSGGLTLGNARIADIQVVASTGTTGSSTIGAGSVAVTFSYQSLTPPSALELDLLNKAPEEGWNMVRNTTPNPPVTLLATPSATR